jgi:peptidyl-dipeptidase A
VQNPVMQEAANFVEKITEQVRPLEKAFYLAEWEAAVTGSKEAIAQVREAQVAYLRFWSDPELFEAAKRLYEGEQADDPLLSRQLKLVYLAAARSQGFRDHFHCALLLDETDEQELLVLFDDLEAQSREPFTRLKARIDKTLSSRFGVLEKELAVATYTGLGMDVGSILSRSDLYPRPGKNQHAFCIDLDREGDIRTLNNLQPTHRWAETLLHELGHGVYDQYVDASLPWLLRSPAHAFTTEAVATLMGSLTFDPEWYAGVLGIPEARARSIAASAFRGYRDKKLIFTRWCLTMTHFERLFYSDPEADLDKIWWDCVERYQLLRRPDGRRAPDWAAKIHVVLFPVYYHNYELGHLMVAQMRRRLEEQLPDFR